MKRWLCLIVIGLAAYAASGLYFVQPDEQAVVRRCGRALSQLRGPGAHFGLPWGWDRVFRVKPREVKRVTLGPLNLGGEAVGAAVPQFLTGDRNLVNVRATIQYTIADTNEDPVRYLFTVPNVERVIARSAEASLTQALASQPVDHALTLGKQELADVVRNELQLFVQRCRLGVAVRSVDIGSVQPPPEVAEAFDKVISSLRERDQQINQSHSYASRTLAQAQAMAQRQRDEAHGYRDRQIQQAEGDASRFQKLLAEYERSPELTAQRLYLETMEEILPKFRSKLIVDKDSDLDVSIIGRGK